MTERFAKVPEWLPAALNAAERQPGDAHPGTACMAFVMLAARADFKTWRALIHYPTLMADLACSERTARRAVDLLERAGALTSFGDWCELAVDKAAVPVTGPGSSAIPVATSAKSVPDPAIPVALASTSPQVRAAIGATPRTDFLSEAQQVVDGGRVVQSPLMAIVPEDRSPELPEWMRGSDKLAAVRALRQEDNDGARLPDTVGTRGEDADEERTGTE